MFSEKVVLITGASSGIGAATAIHFASLGARLALTGRNLTNLLEVAEKCQEKSNQKPLTIQGDLSLEDDNKKVLETTIKTYGKLDILVNNAAILEMGSIEKTDLNQYDRIFNTNVRAVYLLTYLATPYLIKTKGNIVNVSSLGGIRAFPGGLAYCMSKSALDQFTKCVALDLAPKGIRVNSVNPGLIPTNLHRSVLSNGEYEEYKENAKASYPGKRVGTPEEVAEAIAFLASDQSSFITGTLLPVDGGKNLMCPR